MIYIFVLILTVIGILKYDINNSSFSRSSLKFYSFILLVTIMISGLSYRLGIDTERYEEMFREAKSLWNLSAADFRNTKLMPGWILFMSTCKSVFPSFYFFRFIYACILNYSVFRFIKENTKYIYTVLICYYCISFFAFNFEIMRQGLCIALFLCSYKYIVQKDYLRYYILCFAIFSIHNSAFILFLLPLMNFKISKSLFVLLLIIFASMIFLSQYLLGYVYVLLGTGLLDAGDSSASDILDAYNDGRYGDGVLSISNLIGYVYNIFIPFLLLFWVNKRYEMSKYNCTILTLVIVNIMSIAIPVCFRFVKYFDVFLSLFYVESIILFSQYIYRNKQSARKLLVTSILIFYIYHGVGVYFKISDDLRISSIYKYYPYSSVIEKSTDSRREYILSWYHRYF